MKTNLSFYKKQDLIRLRVEHAFQNLLKFKKEQHKDAFNLQLLEILPEVKKYINGRLNTAIRKGYFSKNKYKADDLVDQLFIEIYDHIDEVKKEKDFYLWLFKKTNALIEDVHVEEEFNDLFLKNIDIYSKPEWEEMEEDFSTDGDGDLIMIEELDDYSYNHNDYTLDDVFIEDEEKALTQQLDKTLNKNDINKHINNVLHNLSLSMCSVFELARKHYFNLEEISQIKNIKYEEAKKLFNDTKKALQVSLFNRYGTK